MPLPSGGPASQIPHYYIANLSRIIKGKISLTDSSRGLYSLFLSLLVIFAYDITIFYNKDIEMVNST